MRRIQRQRTKGWRMPEGAVYVGRPSRWGNPWRAGSIGGPRTATEAVQTFRLLAQTWTRDRLSPLRGHDLVCWCPEPCGVDVALYGIASGDVYEPCAKPRGHTDWHDPSVEPWCHADVLLELANATPVDAGMGGE